MTSASPKGKQSPPKSGSGKTVPKAVPHQSISHNDSFESVGTSVAAASGSQLPLPQTNSHSMINCKHLPNRQTFLRLYYDVIRNISTLSSNAKVCEVCGSGGSPLFACLQCVHFSCCHQGTDHYSHHNHDTGHALSVECSTGVLRCIICKVHIWNNDLEKVFDCARRAILPGFLLREPNQNQNEDELDSRVFTKHCVGIKGLYNLGNTCFMNSILQPLLHIPELVNYFLSYGPTSHRKSQCNASQSDAPCVACEVDALFIRMYNGNKKPFCPSDLLYAVWRSSSEMAGYEQQDAHEFFVCLRTALHRALGGMQFNCSCIVHQLFAGVLQSDVTCPQCRNTTETYDPFLDISLDLMLHGAYLGSLEECLVNFTTKETIAMDAYKCSHCNQTVNDVSKRMAIRASPKCLVIHLKRFEHGASRIKIDKHITFPAYLDMFKYSSDYQDHDEMEDDFGMIDTSASHQSGGSLYKLMAVVSHVGSLDSGHYTSYLRYRDQWFFVDDANVTLTTESAVLGCQAYMLFYSSLTPTL